MTERRSIVYKATSELIPYVGNSRTHSPAQVKQIAASMQTFGFTNPILINENDGLIAGHGRVLAAELLKISEVPCVVIAGLTPAEQRALVLADNQIALNSGWDMEKLALEVEALKDLDYNTETLGFTDEFLSDLVGAGIAALDGLPGLPTGEKGDLEQITFTLDSEQAERIRQAVVIAHGAGDFSCYTNENKNGNALAWICEAYLGQQGAAHAA